MMIRTHVLAVALCGAMVMSMFGCASDKKAPGESKKPPRVEVATAEKTRMVEILQTTGDVVAVNTVTLESTVEGPISFCPWREGDRVDHGQKLIEIDRPLYRQDVEAAKAILAVAKAKLADLKACVRPEEIRQAKEVVRHFQECTDFAKADLDRIHALVESGALPAETVEKARVSYVECHSQLEAAKEQLAMLEEGATKTEIKVAEAAVEEASARVSVAQAKLDECLLKAPFEGIVTEVFVRTGDMAAPRDKLLKMMDPSSLVVRAGLPENCVADIRLDATATVRLDAFPDKTFNAKIERIYPRLEWDSRTRIIEVKILESVELIPHLFARVSVQGRVAEDAIVIPDAAIVTTPRGRKIVFVIQDGKASQRQVTLGLELGNRVQVLKGVQPGEMVATAGNLSLKDGASVQSDMAVPISSIQKTTPQITTAVE
jgi:HlyD family secretion protein